LQRSQNSASYGYAHVSLCKLALDKSTLHPLLDLYYFLTYAFRDSAVGQISLRRPH